MSAPARNPARFALPDEPRLKLEDFRERVIGAVRGGKALLSLCSLSEADGPHLCAALGSRTQGTIELALSERINSSYWALTPDCPQAHLFEREIFEQHGLRPEGHPWLKPVRLHGKDSNAGPYEYFQVEGAEIHEVAVGPVHAGIIEPGHFRFQCNGERVFHLEISLGYQHRGLELALLEQPARRLFYMEAAAGDTTIGHTLAYCRIAQAFGDGATGKRTEALRACALELERLANHTGDLGALAGDTGYLPTMSYCGRLRGDFLNMTALLCGSRFGRGLLCETGVKHQLHEKTADELLRRLKDAGRDTENAANLLWETPSVLARFEETGRLSAQQAEELGIVGPAARASGLDKDARRDFPSGYYLSRRNFQPALCQTGDVFARAKVRWLEIKESLALLRLAIPHAIGAPEENPLSKFAPNSIAIALEEGWRGEICHLARTGPSGELDYYKITDPSFRNWTALAQAMRGQQISDFPLCNKSFNLSYCGYDL